MKKIALLFIFCFIGISLFAQPEEDLRDIESNLRDIQENFREQVVTGFSTGNTPFIFYGSSGNANTSLALNKSFNMENIDTSNEFFINEDLNFISLSLAGTCEKGEIILSIVMPDGEIMQQLSITSAANTNWNSSFRLDENSEKYFGAWTLNIKAIDAVGSYNFRVNSRNIESD